MPSEFEKQYARTWLFIGMAASVVVALLLGFAAYGISTLIG